MKSFSINKYSTALALCLLGVIALPACKGYLQAATENIGKDSAAVIDTLVADTAEYIGSGKGLNDIRFANYTDNDWLDNEYIRCLRRYIDDYNGGKIKNKELDQYKGMLKGKFVIGWAEPYLMGGLFLQIIFVDYPNDMFNAWVYSTVDEETETVLDYEVRSMGYDEEKSGFTKTQILELMKEHPELKLW